jgi:hypothetical protein
VTLVRLLDKRRFPAACSAIFLVAGICAVASVRPAFAQSSESKKGAIQDYALIYGTVWGPNDQPVAGVPITIRRSIDKKPKWQLVSDRQGEFAQRVPVGKDEYIVQADIKMPKGEPKPEVTVQINDNERQDIGIHLKSLGAKQ